MGTGYNCSNGAKARLRLPSGEKFPARQKRCTLFTFKIMISSNEGKNFSPNSPICITIFSAVYLIFGQKMRKLVRAIAFHPADGKIFYH